LKGWISAKGRDGKGRVRTLGSGEIKTGTVYRNPINEDEKNGIQGGNRKVQQRSIEEVKSQQKHRQISRQGEYTVKRGKKNRRTRER